MKVAVYGEPIESSSEKKSPDKWEVQCAADTLIRAEEIRQNKELHDMAMEEITKKKKAINSVPTSIDDLKKISKQKDKEE